MLFDLQGAYHSGFHVSWYAAPDYIIARLGGCRETEGFALTGVSNRIPVLGRISVLVDLLILRRCAKYHDLKLVSLCARILQVDRNFSSRRAGTVNSLGVNWWYIMSTSMVTASGPPLPQAVRNIEPINTTTNVKKGKKFVEVQSV